MNSTFSQTHKVGNNGINANFVFQHSCSFLHYLYLKILVNVKFADFIGLYNFEWHGQIKVGNIAILVMSGDLEKLQCVCPFQTTPHPCLETNL